MRGTCHTALNPKRCLKAPREAKLIAVYIYISLPMLGQLCKRAAHSEFPGKHNSPELFSSSTECLCSPRGLSAGSKMSFLGQACKYLLSSSGKCRVTPPTPAISVLPSSTGQAVGCHSHFSWSWLWRNSRGWSLHLLQRNRIFPKSLEIQS